MPFAVPQDTLPADRSADRPEPSALKQRTGTTAVLLGMVLCAVTMKVHGIQKPEPALHQAAQNGDVAAPAKIIAPEFCKDQTWPYIDSRCLRRVDNPAPPTTEPRIVAPPANTTAAAPAPNDANNSTISASTTGSAAAPAAAAPSAVANQDDNAAAPASATTPADPRMQVMQSVFPTTAPSAASESGVAHNDVASYQHTGDDWQHHRHWNHRSNFFGFHF